MNSIDTIYEYAGLKLAGILHEVLAGAGLPLIVGLAGAAWVAHQMASEKATLRDLATYVFFLAFAWWLLSPAKKGDIEAPRLLLYAGEGMDVLQRRIVARVNKRFLDAPFEWERLAAMASFGRILDPALARDAEEFLEGCAKPAIAKSAPAGANVFRPGTLPYGPACESARAALWGRLKEHVARDRFHLAALEAARRRDPGQAAAFEERYLDSIAARAVDEPGSPTSEAALVRASLGEYSYFDMAQSTGDLPFGEEIINVGVSGAAQLAQNWSTRFSAKQKYYLATAYGPHVYGLALMLAMGLFPAAGLWALVPGKWRVLVNWGKVFVSVKLWPVGWAALTAFNARRSALEALDPGGRGTGDVFLGVASMYLLVPGIAFLVVHLAASAAAMPFAPAAPPAAGPGLGPAGPVVRAAV